MARGLFIVLDGGDGSGKTTQTKRLVSRLEKSDRKVLSTREPGGTELGSEIRRLLLESTNDVSPRAEALLMAADRAQHVAEFIKPNLEQGFDVVSDRYVPASIAYQGVGRALGTEWVAELNNWATDGFMPDLVIVLDVSEENATSRGSKHPDRIEREGAQYHSQVRAAYRDLASEYGWTVIDGNGDPETVEQQIWSIVQPLL